jgi:hypothetical protein
LLRIGTFKSARTNTVFPLTSISVIDRILGVVTADACIGRHRPIDFMAPEATFLGVLRRSEQIHFFCRNSGKCLDHVVIFGERHLHRVMALYSLYYNETRTDLGLAKEAPIR